MAEHFQGNSRNSLVLPLFDQEIDGLALNHLKAYLERAKIDPYTFFEGAVPFSVRFFPKYILNSLAPSRAEQLSSEIDFEVLKNIVPADTLFPYFVSYGQGLFFVYPYSLPEFSFIDQTSLIERTADYLSMLMAEDIVPTLIHESFNILPDTEKESLSTFLKGLFPIYSPPYHGVYSSRRRRLSKRIRDSFLQFNLDREINYSLRDFTRSLLYKISQEEVSAFDPKTAYHSFSPKIKSHEDYLTVLRDLIYLVRDHIPQLREEFRQSITSSLSRQVDPFEGYDSLHVLRTIYKSLYTLVR